MAIVVDNPVLQITRGDTYKKTFWFKKRDPDVPDAVIPLDLRAYGDTWAAQLRRTEDAEEVITFTVDSSEADTGAITLYLSHSQTEGISSKGVWDLQVTDTTQTPPFVRTMLRGDFVRIKDVTRP